MLPLKWVCVTGLLAPIAQVSVMPRPSIMALFVAACQSRAVASEAAMPPAWVSLSDEKSMVLKMGCCINALNKVFTPGRM